MKQNQNSHATAIPSYNFDTYTPEELNKEKGSWQEQPFSGDKPLITTFQVLDNGDLAEQIVDKSTGVPTFLVYEKKTGKLSKHSEIVSKGKTYIPLNTSLVSRNVILFPSDAYFIPNYKYLRNQIRKFIYKYADLSPFFLELATHYVLLTWVFDNASTIAYLGIYSSDKGVGKTRIAKTIGSICYKPIITAGSTTPAAIYRLMTLVRGTMVLNEFDFDNSDLSSEIIKILNNGYEKGMSVLRVQVNGSEVEAFDAFSPKIFTYRKKKKDEAFESRLITITAEETTREDIPIELPESFEKEAAILRNHLLMYRFKRYYTVKTVDPTLLLGLNRRLRQTLSPILRVVDDEVFLNELIAFANEYQNDLRTEQASSWMAEVVRTLARMVETSEVITAGNFAIELTKTNALGENTVINAKRAGSIARNDLGFRSMRITSGAYKGQYGIQIDKTKLQKLCEKYDIETASESSLSHPPSPYSSQDSELSDGSERK